MIPTVDVCEIVINPGIDANSDGIIDSCQCITDLNFDGATDFTDVVLLLSCWLQEPDGCVLLQILTKTK